MRCTIRLDTSGIRAGLQKKREAAIVVLKSEMERIAEQALNKRYWDLQNAGPQDSGQIHGRLNKLNSLFVPVALQHKRRERWPDIAAIYDAMVRRHQQSYMGTRKFWVDEIKLDDFRTRILQRLMRNGLARGTWTIVIQTDRNHYVTVTVQKVGRATAMDKKAGQQLAVMMQQMFAERQSTILYQILNTH
jgi:hypothetical protein